MKRFAFLSLVIAGFLLIGRCAAAVSQEPKPCEFFAKQAAEAIFGAPLDAGRDKAMSCEYPGAGGDEQKGLFVYFIPASGATAGMTMQETYDNVTPVPCSKQEVKFDVDAGTAARFFGLTNGAGSSVSLFTKTYTHWAPDTPFCRGV